MANMVNVYEANFVHLFVCVTVSYIKANEEY